MEVKRDNKKETTYDRELVKPRPSTAHGEEDTGSGIGRHGVNGNTYTLSCPLLNT